MKNIAFVIVAFLYIGGMTTCGHAAGGVVRVVKEGDSITNEHAAARGWPAGVLPLVNDPLRTDGWRAWFSGIAHFPEHFELSPRSHEGVQHLIDKFAAIESENLRLRWATGKQPKSLGTIPVRRNILELAKQRRAIGSEFTVVYGDKGTTAVLSIGDRNSIELLRATDVPESEKQRFYHFPTLTIYVGNEFVDPARFKVPRNIAVHKEDGDELQNRVKLQPQDQGPQQ